MTVVRRHLVTGFDPQHRGDLVAEARIRCGHRDRLGEGRHRQQHLFDLQGTDVLATSDDDVGLAVGQIRQLF